MDNQIPPLPAVQALVRLSQERQVTSSIPSLVEELEEAEQFILAARAEGSEQLTKQGWSTRARVLHLLNQSIDSVDWN